MFNSFSSEYLLTMFFLRNYNMTKPHIKLWKKVLPVHENNDFILLTYKLVILFSVNNKLNHLTCELEVLG